VSPDHGDGETLIPHAAPPPSAASTLGITVICTSFRGPAVTAASCADALHSRLGSARLAAIPVAPITGAAQLDGGAAATAAASSKLHSAGRSGGCRVAHVSSTPIASVNLAGPPRQFPTHDPHRRYPSLAA
jgi:hypothetical protein